METGSRRDVPPSESFAPALDGALTCDGLSLEARGTDASV